MKNLAFWILLLSTFGLAALDKIFSGGVPDWFLDQFKSTILNLAPGLLEISYYFILTLELLTFLSIAVGLCKREFLNSETRYLSTGSLLAQLTFVVLGFGQRLTHKYDAAFQLFAFAVLTFVGSYIALDKGVVKNGSR